MIERVMAQPIFMFTRVALSALITASAGIMMISFLYFAWTFIEDVYKAITPEEETVVEETSIDEFPHIQPITVTATKRSII
tara:strand:- start:5792 stop:6034 length:243 start_codon:yes stop_codon:yes gene_type:complete